MMIKRLYHECLSSLYSSYDFICVNVNHRDTMSKNHPSQARTTACLMMSLNKTEGQGRCKQYEGIQAMTALKEKTTVQVMS
jgi:hypothetical protein